MFENNTPNLKVLTVLSGFPIHQNSSRNQYFWHSVEATEKLGIKQIILETHAWKPFRNTRIDCTQFPVPIITARYFSIPRYYYRCFSNYLYLIRITAVIQKLVKKNKIDVIHAHGEICGLAAVTVAKQLKIPVVVTIHGVETCLRMWKKKAKSQFIKMFHEANRLVFVGESLLENFKSMIKKQDHCRIVHNGFRLPENNSNQVIKKENGLIRFISVSNLNEGKGVDLTLRALAELKKQGITNWIYKIIGTGDQKKLCEKIITEYRLEDKIVWLGECSHQVVYDHLQNSDIFCLPSYREAFGIAYIEAMAHGLLAIGVKGQGPDAFIKSGETGLLVEPQDVKSLVETIRFAICNLNESEMIGNRGRQHVLNNFTWERHAEKLIALYREII